MPHARFLAVLGAATVLSTFAIAACKSRCCAPAPRPAYAPATSPPATAFTFEAQATHGGRVYAATCARCHGAAGQGSDSAPALVGAGALPSTPPAGRKFRTSPFRTVADVQAFVASTMPPGGPALSQSDAFAVVAFALKANGMTLERPLDPAYAASLPVAR